MIRQALLSVYDKAGLLPFARFLVQHGVKLLSTGGTLRALVDAGIDVTSIETYTGSPEVMGGRVKTLHPRVHGGILMRGDIDAPDLERLGGAPIDLVVVNLYPFVATASRAEALLDEVIEQIDIGGPSMIRAAAKNHARVAVVCDPTDYEGITAEFAATAEITAATRRKLAAKAFAHTAAYDGAVAAYLSSLSDPVEAEASTPPEREAHPRYITLAYERAYGLRYGENPHQSGAFYRERDVVPGALGFADSLGAGGKELSFNNLVDVDAALECVREFDRPAAVVVKHANPAGVAVSDELAVAYRLARDADATSAFGGIVAFNRAVDKRTADILIETFLECVVAPSFSDEALAVLRTKKNLRLLATGVLLAPDLNERVFKRISGGIVVQSRDATSSGEVASGRIVSNRSVSPEELGALDLAWRACKHVKSNAIVLAKPGRTVGVGAGQMSRVESVRIAARKAGSEAAGSVLASDAFFPFPDGVELALEAGVTAFVQPGGSVKDADVIAAVNKAGAAMIFTGVRHFRH
jgi:phosphoribosylaminoimidazolecarboxamide formyltransferase/IMP cyclohydrolase